MGKTGKSIWHNLKREKSELKWEYNIPDNMAPRSISGIHGTSHCTKGPPSTPHMVCIGVDGGGKGGKDELILEEYGTWLLGLNKWSH
jgi:hypothetical protein